MKRTLTILLAVAMCVVASSAFAQMMPGKGMMMEKKGMMAMGGMKDKPCPMMAQGMMGHDKDMGHKAKGLKAKFFGKLKLIWKNADGLGVTEEQMASLKSLKMATKKELIMKEAEIEVVAIDITAAMMEDPVDLEAVGALLDKKYQLKKAKAKIIVAACAEIKKVLTGEQKANLKKLMK